MINRLTPSDTLQARLEQKFPSSSASKVRLKRSMRDRLVQQPVTVQDFGPPPSRLDLDQLVNIFFQEWAPLFPVLDKSAYLQLYSKHLADPTSTVGACGIAQLNLVWSLAASSNDLYQSLVLQFESHWMLALDAIIRDTSISTMQCVALAQLYCLARSHDRLAYYRSLGVGMLARCISEQRRRGRPADAPTKAATNKIICTMYTLDSFGAAILGHPRLIQDDWADIEDLEGGNLEDDLPEERKATLANEDLRSPCAMEIFRASKILSQVLKDLYPSKQALILSSRLQEHYSNLDRWRNELPPYLRLELCKDKPSTNVISSRCPLLALVYYFIRSLIHRPAALASSGHTAASSELALADSSKHIIQIIELLQERQLSFTLPISLEEMLLLAEFGLIIHTLDLDQESKLHQDNKKYIMAAQRIIKTRSCRSAPVSESVVDLLFPSRDSPSTKKPPKSRKFLVDAHTHLLGPKPIARKADETQHVREPIKPGTTKTKNPQPYSAELNSSISQLASAHASYASFPNLDYLPLCPNPDQSSSSTDIVLQSRFVQSDLMSDGLGLGLANARRATDTKDFRYSSDAKSEIGLDYIPLNINYHGRPLTRPLSVYGETSWPDGWDKIGLANPGTIGSLLAQQQSLGQAHGVLSVSTGSITSGEEQSRCSFASDWLGCNSVEADGITKAS